MIKIFQRNKKAEPLTRVLRQVGRRANLDLNASNKL